MSEPERLAEEGRQITVLSSLPHYPGRTVLPACQNGRLTRETIGGVRQHHVKPPILSALSS